MDPPLQRRRHALPTQLPRLAPLDRTLRRKTHAGNISSACHRLKPTGFENRAFQINLLQLYVTNFGKRGLFPIIHPLSTLLPTLKETLI